MAHFIHFNNQTNGPVAYIILSTRSERVSLNPLEMLLDQVFKQVDKWLGSLVDTNANVLNVIGSNVIPARQTVGHQTDDWLNIAGGQGPNSDVFLLGLKSGAFASWRSNNDQSWLFDEDRIYPVVHGTTGQVDQSLPNLVINWNNVSLSDAAQKKIKALVDRYNRG